MSLRLTDDDIRCLLAERKPLPGDYALRLQLKPKRGHKEREMQVKGGDGSDFRIILRQSDLNPLDFSVVLVYQPLQSNQLFRLRRCNGKSHEHTNKLEGERFYGYHIHTATERYQDAGFREDAYAEATRRYSDLDGALKCLLEDCAFDVPSDGQLALFPEGGMP